MAVQTTFKRYEIKYLLNKSEKQQLLKTMEQYMQLDKYGRHVIRNIYYDTDNYRLIRHSLEKPVYKEKLRIRSYQPAGPEDTVFVELKKKYDHIVYKRRITMSEAEAMDSFNSGAPLPVHSQIADEIDYFRAYYENLEPKVFISYEREAYCEKDGGDFRVTFDENIRFREYDLSLGSEAYGTPILQEGMTLMEIKTPPGMPLWMCHELSRLGIRKTSFSKYGTAYKTIAENVRSA